MAEVNTIARPYAEAVFELADKSGKLGEWADALARLAEVAAHSEVLAVIGNPNVSDEQRVELFMSTAGEATPGTRNFVQTLAENERLAALPQICNLFEQLKNEREGLVQAEVASAYALTDAELAELVAGLEKRFKRKVQASVRIDPELIGGVRIAVGDEVIDSSIRGKLAAMNASLTG